MSFLELVGFILEWLDRKIAFRYWGPNVTAIGCLLNFWRKKSSFFQNGVGNWLGCCYEKAVGGSFVSGYRNHSILVFERSHHPLSLDFLFTSFRCHSLQDTIYSFFPCSVNYYSSVCSLSSKNLSCLICFCLLSWSICSCISVLFKKSIC